MSLVSHLEELATVQQLCSHSIHSVLKEPSSIRGEDALQGGVIVQMHQSFSAISLWVPMYLQEIEMPLVASLTCIAIAAKEEFNHSS